MTRRDSLGMAAKEHTEKLTQNGGCGALKIEISDDVRRSVQSDTNTYGVKSSQAGSNTSQAQQDNCFVAGTFNGDAQPLDA